MHRSGRPALPRGPGKFTAAKKEEFLNLYRLGGTVVAAANTVGVSHVTVFKHIRDEPDGFGVEFYKAMESNTDFLEDRLLQMAIAGNVAALFGTLKARRPEKWRERSSVDLSNTDGSLSALSERITNAAKEREKALRPEVRH